MQLDHIRGKKHIHKKCQYIDVQQVTFAEKLLTQYLVTWLCATVQTS